MRMTVERLFAVLKRKFKVLVVGANEGYSQEFQAKIPIACMVIHNFLTRRKLAGVYSPEFLECGDLHEAEVYRPSEAHNMSQQQEIAAADWGRRRVAQAIWDNRE